MELNYQELLENLMHELGRINSIIKTSSEAISKSMKGNLDRETVSHHSEVILENSFLLSTHLDIVTYQLNPSFFGIEDLAKRNIYGKFHKAILSYKRAAKQKNIQFSVTGSAKSFIDTYPVIDTLPILIIDNAFKYSPKDGEIEIDFFEDDDEIEITISNVGPYVLPSERKKIFERGYRGSEAIKTKLPGLGYGMSFIKYICDLHEAEIELICSDDCCNIGSVKYGEFKLILKFLKKLA